MLLDFCETLEKSGYDTDWTDGHTCVLFLIKYLVKLLDF